MRAACTVRVTSGRGGFLQAFPPRPRLLACLTVCLRKPGRGITPTALNSCQGRTNLEPQGKRPSTPIPRRRNSTHPPWPSLQGVFSTLRVWLGLWVFSSSATKSLILARRGTDISSVLSFQRRGLLLRPTRSAHRSAASRTFLHRQSRMSPPRGNAYRTRS
jgi:hypothetical protein